MISNPHALGLHNPETSRYPLDHQEPNCPIHAPQTRRDRLVARSQNNHPGRVRRIIAACVRKIRVECDKDALLALAGSLHDAVVHTCQTFLVNVVDVPTLLLKPLASGARQVLVELESHGVLRRDR